MQNDKTVIVLAGGDPVEVPAKLPKADYVIAADSGLEQADRLGLQVNLVVGDMDSVDPVTLEAAAVAGTTMKRFPADKDATDLELALDAAIHHGAGHIVVMGGTGGRLDHFLANALLIASPAWADVDIEWLIGPTRIVAVRHQVRLHGSPGDILTLLAVGEPADGVTTTGLRYPLNNGVLLASSTLGVSNVFTGEEATVTVGNGVILAIHVAGER